MRLIEDDAALGARLELEPRIGGEQLAQLRLLEIEVGQLGKRVPGQRGLADLSGTEDENGWKLPPQRSQAKPGQPLPHPCKLEGRVLICKNGHAN